MKSLAAYKGPIIVTVITGLALMGYFYYTGSSMPADDAGLVANSVQGVGSVELALLNQVKSLKIDVSFFTDPTFLTLQDFSMPIPTENVGRPNPFAPIPGLVRIGAAAGAQ